MANGRYRNHHRGNGRNHPRQQRNNTASDASAGAHRIVNSAGQVNALIGNHALPPHSHPGLIFDRYLKIWQSPSTPELHTGKQQALDQFVRDFGQSRQYGQPMLDAIHQRQSIALQRLDGTFREITLTNHEPLALSLGNPHPLENGASFDNATGAPCLTGSAIKGLIRRAHKTLGLAEKRDIDRWLGPDAKPSGEKGGEDKTFRGELRVLDAYPRKWPRLAVDIINSHHSAYYVKGPKKGARPVETESPVPVFFLTVANNADWVFRFGGKNLTDSELDTIATLLETALAWLGIGGKTAVGYGKMRRESDKAVDYSLPDALVTESAEGDHATMNTSSQATNPAGKSFISYKRERADEIRLVIEAQHERGILTWQDVKDLKAGNTVTRIREVLADPQTTNAVLWLTPEIENSPTIQREEIPAALQRQATDKRFFVLPVAAGGLDARTAPDVIDPSATIPSITNQYILECKNDPPTPQDAATIANRLLDHRLPAIVDELKPGDPLRIGLYCANVPNDGFHLLVDWSHCCENKKVRPGAWRERLIPAALDLRDALARHAQGAPILLTGMAPLPVMTMLGSVFSETSGLKVEWQPPQSPEQHWSIDAEREDPGLLIETLDESAAGEALAILLDAMGGGAMADFKNSRKALPAFRVVQRIAPDSQGREFRIDSAGVAAEFAWRVRETINRARDDYPGIQSIHLFMAAPAGLAFMIGQLLNRFGNVQLYNHNAQATPPYSPALRYTPHPLDLGLADGNVTEG